MDEVYERGMMYRPTRELETPEEERNIYRKAKARDKSTKYFTQIRHIIKDEQGVVLWEHDTIIERWYGYYGKMPNEEHPRTVFGDRVLGGTCIATDNACKLVINLIFNTIIYRIYIQYGYL